MANPQVEHGHLELANEIVESLAKIRISGTEWQLLWVILRKTYGWHKKRDAIPLTQFRDMTGLSGPHTVRSLKKLLRKKVIVATRAGGATIYGFNKDFEKWAPMPKKVTVTRRDAASKEVKVPKEDAEAGRREDEGRAPANPAPKGPGDADCRASAASGTTRPTANDLRPGSPVGGPPRRNGGKAAPGGARKEAYGNHVELTREEYEKLAERFEGAVADVIEFFDLKIESKGVAQWRMNHRSDYATILYWERNGWIRLGRGGAAGPHSSPAPPLSASSQGIMGWAERERERMKKETL
jgi:phage replication O-like protein O